MASERTDKPIGGGGGWRAWPRHGGALAATIALNAVLLAFLLAWRAGHGEAQPPVRAVPLQVVEPEVVETEPEEPEPVVEIAEPEPVEEPPLPEPPLPEPMPPELPDEPPPPMRLDIDVPLATETPAFEALLPLPVEPPPVQPPPPPPPKPRPVPPKPTPRPAPKPTPKPKPPPAPRRGPDRSPVVLEPPDLSAYYPRRARMRGISGRSTIRVTIDRRGAVTEVQVLDSTPAGVFEHAAGRVGRSLGFRPALRNGEPVAATMTVSLVWRLE